MKKYARKYAINSQRSEKSAPSEKNIFNVPIRARQKIDYVCFEAKER